MLPLFDRRHGHVSQGHNGGAAWAVVDQRHFAENVIRAESFQATVPASDLDLSTLDNKELVALFALPEDRVSGTESSGLDLRPQEKIEINLFVSHLDALARCGDELMAETLAKSLAG
jgi:hypothetical protein